MPEDDREGLLQRIDERTKMILKDQERLRLDMKDMFARKWVEKIVIIVLGLTITAVGANAAQMIFK